MSAPSACRGLLASLALDQVPRLLGLMDRRPGSATFGCADRYYWHYRLHDLANARFQEVCWPLALACCRPLPDNPFHAQERLREWVQAAVGFWGARRHRDGSVDEVYPFERSFCATSFSTLAVTEALRLMAGAGRPLRAPRLEPTGRWLAAHERPEVANQMAAAAAALYNLAELTGEAGFERAAEEKVARLLSAQDGAGFFPEYGGPDTGYLSLTLSCCALILARRSHPALLEAARRAGEFLERSLDECGRGEPRRNQRRTQYHYPLGLAAFAPGAFERWCLGLERRLVIGPHWLDDRYCIGLAADFLAAAVESTDAAHYRQADRAQAL